MSELVALTATDARALTDRIKVAVEAVWEYVKEAYTCRAWAALGYESWDDYCTREFGTSRLRLPREERAEVVASLRESGMSVRAIAAATGLGYGTTSREIARSPDPNGSPDPITGTDGKTYTPRPTPEIEPEIDIDDDGPWEPTPPPRRPEPKRQPLPGLFQTSALEAERVAQRVEKYADDDRFKKNAGQIADHTLGTLTRARDALSRVITQLEGYSQQ